MLGQFSKRFLLINGLEKELCKCVPDFFLSRLKEQGSCVEFISFSCAANGNVLGLAGLGVEGGCASGFGEPEVQLELTDAWVHDAW